VAPAVAAELAVWALLTREAEQYDILKSVY
jgi:hypothetical protein